MTALILTLCVHGYGVREAIAISLAHAMWAVAFMIELQEMEQ